MGSLLHLTSLAIEGFRGIRELEFPQLGRVTLLAGENGVGKTTVLDAIRLYASRGDGRVLVNLIDAREEFMQSVDDDGDTVLFPDFGSLFHDYDPHEQEGSPTARIRSKPGYNNLSLELVDAQEDADAQPTLFAEPRPQDLAVRIGQRKPRVLRAGPMAYYGRRPRIYGRPRVQRRPDSWPAPIHFESLGPGLLRNPDVARLWDGVVLTEAEGIALEALRLVVGKRLERLTVVGDPEGGGGRRVVVKLAARSAPVPLAAWRRREPSIGYRVGPCELPWGDPAHGRGRERNPLLCSIGPVAHGLPRS